RLNFLNGHYIREMSEDRWRETVTEWCTRELPPSVPRPLDATLIAEVARLLRERVARLDEIAPQVEFLFGFEAPGYAPGLLAERIGGDTEIALRVVDAGLAALDAIPESDWDKEHIEAAIRAMEEPLALKPRKFIPTLYAAEMARTQGIPLFDSMAILGRERSLHRLRTARARLEHGL
ncbi:MAG: hypothetical protein ABI305_06755, partial [Tepidiformaceae bacterium]